jgi:hypothetical protein
MALAPVLGRVYIDVPPFAPSTSGILAAAQATGTLFTLDDGNPAIRGFQFDTDGIKQIVTFNVVDCESTATAAAFDGEDVVQSGNPFTVYGGYECSLAVTDMDKAKTIATRRLTNGETVGVERNLWANVFPAAIDITPTPGVAVKPAAALGIAAEYAGNNYAGVPLYHAGRRLSVSLAAQQLVEAEPLGHVDNAAIKGGGILVNGGGYVGTGHPSTANAPTSTQCWLYVTGRVVLVRDQIDTYQGVKTNHNNAVTIAERTYVPAVESILAAVLVDLSDGAPSSNLSAANNGDGTYTFTQKP